MRLRDFWIALRRRWLVVMALMLAGLAAGGAYTLIQRPLYESSAQAFVSTGAATSVADLSQGTSFTQQAAKSYAQVAQAPIVLDRVIEELRLAETAATLEGSVSSTVPLDTSIINIDVSSRTPKEAASIANSVAENLAQVVKTLSPSSQTDSAVKVTVISPATPNPAATSPRPWLNLALGGLTALILGAAAVAAIGALDTRIRTSQDLETLAPLPVLGLLSRTRRSQDQVAVTMRAPQSPAAEAVRTLRTNLRFLDPEASIGQAFTITSSVASEGKTTTAVNLAIAAAEAGRRVLLVDADLRRPRVADVMSIDGGVGLTDVLTQGVTVDEAVQPWGHYRLAVLAAGPVPPNPAELLGTTAMSDLIEQWRREYEIVILDGPPLLPVTDAALLSRMAAGAIIVCAAGRTRSQQLLGALRLLEQTGARAFGIVLTMLPERGEDAYGYSAGYYPAAQGPSGRRPTAEAANA